MKTYQHTQRSTVIIVALVAISVVLITVGHVTDKILFLIVPMLLLSAWLFSSLTIEIVDGELRWSFGPGLIRKRITLSDVASAKAVRTNFSEGWGIHLSRFGWLYNASGFDAVAITLRNGKRFALGTDEAEILASQISIFIRKS